MHIHYNSACHNIYNPFISLQNSANQDHVHPNTNLTNSNQGFGTI